MSDTVTTERVGSATVVTIRRPEVRNAVDPTTASALEDAFRAFDSDDSSSVAVLTGEGTHFCAGADLKAISTGDFRPVTEDGEGPMGPTRMLLSKPVIAAVEGYAVAGGLELAVWCDLRVASTNAVFGVFCRRFGVPLIDLGTVRLPRLVGQSRALDMILTGRPVDANEAFHIGLVNRIAEPGKALDGALFLAEQIAQHPQTCMRNDRLSAIEQWSLGWDEAMRNEVRHGLDTISSAETVTGAGRFVAGEGRGGSFDQR